MRYIALMILILALLLGSSTPAGVQEAKGFNKTALDSTFVLYGRMIDPQTKKVIAEPFVCSAFAYERDATGYLLLSAGHCIDGTPVSATFTVSENLATEKFPVTIVSARYAGDAGDSAEDYTVFHLTTSKEYPVLALGDESDESVGNETLNPNFAFGITKHLTHGVIVSQEIDHPVDCPCRGTFLVHEFAGAGASGSPVISMATHKVIGILVGSVITDGFTVEPISLVKHAMTEPDQQVAMHQAQPTGGILELFLPRK